MVQTFIVHLVRHSLNFCSHKDRKIVAGNLKAVDRAERRKRPPKGSRNLTANGVAQYPSIAQSWRSNWEHVNPFFAFPQDIRRMIYTTNTIESLNITIRKP